MELIVNPIYKKLGENEYFVAKAPNFMHLIKPKYEVANGTFITIDSEDKLVELSRHLNDYYYIDENNDLQINQEKKDAFLRQDIIKSFKLEREKYFKV
jgi:hypothetical protein